MSARFLDAGASFAALEAELAKLRLEGYRLSASPVRRGGIGATQFVVETTGHEHHHRRLGDILEMIDRSALAPTAAARAKAIFTRLGQAEAKVHRISVEEVHFHEVGAVDSIIDIVGAAIALDLLGVGEVVCSPIPPGSGTVQCADGLLPVPAPATAELLAGAKVAASELPGEVTTPTGAAILTTLAAAYGPLPAMDLQAVGCGAGTAQEGDLPNVLRVFIGRRDDLGQADSVVELSANLDDCTGEVIGATIAALLEMGCLDAWAVPVYMKKNRPAVVLSAVCLPADVAAVEEAIFRQTSTFGVRRRTCTRAKLHREHVTVETPFGPVRVKVGRRGGQVLTASPEFADCQAAAASHHVAVRQVMESAIVEYRKAAPQ